MTKKITLIDDFRLLAARLVMIVMFVLFMITIADAEGKNDYPITDEVISDVHDQIVARKAYIDVSKYNIPELFKLWNGEYYNSQYLPYYVKAEFGDTFFLKKVEADYNISYSDNDYRTLKGFKATYDDSYDMDAFQKETEKALACINDDMTDLEKVILLHDYICAYTDYDYINFANHIYDTPDTDNAYGVLVKKRAVCEGFSVAYKYLLRLAGIQAYLVRSDEISHMWNVVILDGEAYHVDVTFDNSSWNVLGEAKHVNLLKSDAVTSDMGVAHHPSDAVILKCEIPLDIHCTSDKYDKADWTDANSPICYYEGKFYYSLFNTMLRQAQIVCSDPQTIRGGRIPLVKNVGPWTLFGTKYDPANPYSCIEVSSSLVTIRDGRLFYSTPTGFNSCALDGSDEREEYKVDTSKAYLYGALVIDGEVYYSLDHSDALLEELEILKLTEDLKVEQQAEPEETPAPTAAPTETAASTAKETKNSLPIGAIAGIAAGVVLVVVIIVIVSKKNKGKNSKNIG